VFALVVTNKVVVVDKIISLELTKKDAHLYTYERVCCAIVNSQLIQLKNNRTYSQHMFGMEENSFKVTCQQIFQSYNIQNNTKRHSYRSNLHFDMLKSSLWRSKDILITSSIFINAWTTWDHFQLWLTNWHLM